MILYNCNSKIKTFIKKAKTVKINFNNNLNFKRAIELQAYNCDIDDCFNYQFNKPMPKVQAVIDAITGKPNSIYDKETSTKIGQFLRAQIEDYSPKTGLFSARIEGATYIYTGEDAKKARNIQNTMKNELKAFENDPEEFSGSKYETLQKIEKQNIYLRRDKALVEMVENGAHGKRDTSLVLDSKDGKKVNQIKYWSCIRNQGEYKTTQASLTL